MLEITKINNEIDLLIDANKCFFLKVTESIVAKDKFNKFADFIKYAIESKYTVIKADNGLDMCFMFLSDKKTPRDTEIVYRITDKMSTKGVLNVESVSADKIKQAKPSKNKSMKELKNEALRDTTEQWFNEM